MKISFISNISIYIIKLIHEVCITIKLKKHNISIKEFIIV